MTFLVKHLTFDLLTPDSEASGQQWRVTPKDAGFLLASPVEDDDNKETTAHRHCIHPGESPLGKTDFDFLW